jgi:hypothetical protein
MTEWETLRPMIQGGLIIADQLWCMGHVFQLVHSEVETECGMNEGSSK